MHIHEFQEMMRRIYFHRDSKRGAKGTYDWLKDEVNELGDAMKENNTKALRNEFADVLAWLASLANVLEINLEKATLTKYNGTCPKCQKTTCRCLFSKQP
jgi:NTP pyrophosphatase (non-canonical NTP hydrolase)